MPNHHSPTFQSVIMGLQEFWANQGCVLWQPYYTQLGAGTMNPATFLRVLGPEPWRVAYVEPSVRPDDGRYGENPNRLQQHYQFQVILKPDPGNPQELYLQSLMAIGMSPQRHDIRFVEDNWESPALGAWGLGWEVWLDGQEITQFTYFQQAGGRVLRPVSVELTYGLERILIALQGVGSFVDIRWTEGMTYGDLNLQGEREHSRYYFETADVERLWAMFREYEAEAVECLRRGLVLPAYDHVLKCSHTFNVLDSRGAVGVAERAALFARMRDLARQVADAYLAQRESEGFPWMRATSSATRTQGTADARPAPRVPASFLLEIGTEELPAHDLSSALVQLERGVSDLLSEAQLDHGEIKILGTPRRLVVQIQRLAPAQADRVETVKGPPAERAFDAGGKPTQAALGFARSKGIPVESLHIQEIEKRRYVVAEVRRQGLAADAVLSEKLPGLVASLKFEKAMRWNETDVAFSRPIRWLMALHGDHVVPFTYAGLQSGRSTRGLRFHEPEEVDVRDPQAYFDLLRSQGILLDPHERRAAIWDEACALAGEVGGTVVEDASLLDEVANLMECPSGVRGEFQEQHLALPRQVAVAVMKRHQRYFPVERDAGLLPFFIAFRNGGRENLEGVARGNEHVLGARFADAAYFVRRDMEQPLEAFLPRLESLTFQAELGSVLDKVHRLERLTGLLGKERAWSAPECDVALRAAHLAKADLATRMVVEMTSLQGEMGREYALREGERPEVAEAIFEHLLPRFAGDRVPVTRPGLTVGLADRLDTLIGLFAVGLQPTGASDPFAMRRSAIGTIQSLVANEIEFDLRRGIRLAAAGLPLTVSEGIMAECLQFIIARHQALLLAEGYRYDVVDAVLAAQGHNPAAAAHAVMALEKWTQRDDWSKILQAYARCARIIRGVPRTDPVEPGLFLEEAERLMYQALLNAEATPRRPGSVDDFLSAFQPMIPVIDRFFEEVLVMADDAKVRANRLGLVRRIVDLAEGVAELSKLEGF